MKGVQTGYYDTDNEQFVTRTKDWGTYGIPKELRTEENEEDGYTEVYRTTDGKYFLDEKEAQKHEKTIDAPEVQEVAELLEKAKILCAKYKSEYPVLATVEDAIGQIENDPDYLMDKYHDSTCW